MPTNARAQGIGVNYIGVSTKMYMGYALSLARLEQLV